MSKAFKCNRCGECFDPAKTEYDMVCFDNPKLYEAKGWERYTYKGYLIKLRENELVDLCPKCTWYFKKFMDNYSFTIKMKDGESFEEFMAGFPAEALEDSQQKQGT